jgi:LmbE family N-acetylglucosaminyl deacetylase
MHILAVGAHPDDIEFGCAGTILRHIKRGDEVTFVVLSKGEKGGDPETRVKEAREAAKAVGANINVYDFPDTAIPQSHELIDRLEALIKNLNPRRVYMHSVKDTHQDHRNSAFATLSAARSVPEILAYESPSLYLNFNPNYYVDISNYMEKKMKILNLFTTQNGREYMKMNAIRGLSQFRGLAPSVGHAEAFEIVRILKSDSI